MTYLNKKKTVRFKNSNFTTRKFTILIHTNSVLSLFCSQLHINDDDINIHDFFWDSKLPTFIGTLARTLGSVPYSRIGLLRSYGNLQSYWTTTKLWKLTVVLDYYEAMGTYSSIGLLRSYVQLYWTTTKLWELSVVFDY
jgi:hypothetical protein